MPCKLTMIALAALALVTDVSDSSESAAAGKESSPRRYQAQWIWAKTESPKPFQFVRFRKTFELGESVEKAVAFVTADTFYRLWINDQLAMHGPARSSAGKATVDPVEIASLLKPGRNSIEAEALHYDGRFGALGQAPGFLCELEISAASGRQTIATDSTWESREITAWSRQAPKFSFQRTWVEDFDARLELSPAWTSTVVLGEVGMAPWKIVMLRAVPLPDPRRTIRPARVVGVQRGDGFTGEKAMFLPMTDTPPGTLWEHTMRQWCLCQGFSSGVAAVLNEEILGLRDELPTRIAPHSGGVVRWCKGHVTTPCGRVTVAWDWKRDRYELEVTLPAGVTAEVVLPAEAEAVWHSGPATGVWPGRIQVAGHKVILIQPGKIQ